MYLARLTAIGSYCVKYITSAYIYTLQNMQQPTSTSTEIPDVDNYSIEKREVISEPSGGIQFVRGPPGLSVSHIDKLSTFMKSYIDLYTCTYIYLSIVFGER